jgi:hypothetical protein
MLLLRSLVVGSPVLVDRRRLASRADKRPPLTGRSRKQLETASTLHCNTSLPVEGEKITARTCSVHVKCRRLRNEMG